MASQLKDEVSTALESSVEELQNIWDYIGYDEPDRIKRAKEVSSRIQKIFFDIIEEENRFRLELESNVETKKRQLSDFSRDLGLKPFFPPRGLSTYRLLAVLDEKFVELNTLRESRISQYRELRLKVASYCQRLAEEDGESQAVAEDHLPTDEELKQLTERANDLEERYKGMLTKYLKLREDVVRIAADIDYAPSNDFERAVLDGPSVENGSGDSPIKLEGNPLANSDVALTNETMQELQEWRLRLVKQKAMLVGTCDELRSYLRSMWFRLQMPEAECEAFLEDNAGYKPSTLDVLQSEVDRCQEMKWERSGQYLSNLRVELSELCAKCFVDGGLNLSSSSDEDSEDCINSLEQEIDRLRETYNKNKAMYDAVYNYQRLWEQYLEVEEKMKDPAILSNRGGILLKTDKEKKRLLKELPRVEQEVADEIAMYEEQNKTTFFLSGQRTFSDHVRSLWNDRGDGRRSISATRDRRRLKTPASESPNASPRRKL